MKLGSTDITKGYLGSTEITKAYLGGNLVLEPVSVGTEVYPTGNAASITGEADSVIVAAPFNLSATNATRISLISTTSEVHSGTWSFLFEDLTAEFGEYRLTGFTDTKTYEISFWAKRAIGSLWGRVTFDGFDIKPPNTTFTEDWVKYEYTLTATASARINFNTQVATIGDQWLVDDFSIIEL